jgi:MFS family permease
MTPIERAARRTFHSLRTRNFRLYFFGQVVSGTGSWMQMVAQAWLVLSLTGSGVALGVTLALQFAPMLLLGAWGGVLADRTDKRKLLLLTTSAAGALAIALGLITAVGIVEVWMVYVLAVGLGVVTAIDNPTRRSFVPELVPKHDVANAVGLNSTVFTAARVIGPAFAAVVIAGLGVAWCFLINGLSFAAVLWALSAMRTDELRPSPVVAREEHQLRDGLRYAWSNQPVRLALLITAVIGTLAFNFQVSLPLMADEVFDGDATTLGILLAVLGVGSLAGALWVAHFGRASTRIMISAALALGIAMTAATLAPTLAVELAVLPAVGITSMVLLCMATAVCNEETAPEMRGRVMALLSVAFLGSTPIGAPVIGWVSEAIGPRAGLGIGAIAAIATGLVALLFVRARSEIETADVVPVEPEEIAIASQARAA